jgi:Flp pilus assembly protein TadG
MVEFAILAPILVVLILWSNYFWEVQYARIKAAEAARFVAFERTVRSDLSAIADEAQDRYKDLDGTTKGNDLGSAYKNRLTVTVTAVHAEAPLTNFSLSDMGSKGGAGGIAGAVIGALGATAGLVADAMGLDTSQGAVQTDVEFKIENAIIPQEIALYTTGFSDDRLDLTLRDRFYMYHDTWRAWRPGDDVTNENNVNSRLQQNIYDRSKRITYAGVASGAAGGALSAIGTVLSVLGLDFPFQDSYIRDSIMVKKPEDDGRYPAAGPTRTMPGKELQAAYWTDDDSYCRDSCEPAVINQKRGFNSRSDYNDNWPMRSYNCRGKYFQGATKSNEPESRYAQSYGNGGSYFNYGGDACAE